MTERTRRIGSALWGLAATLLTTAAVIGIFFVAPEDADQGIIQKIFYFHVAIALVSMLAFVVGCVAGIQYLRTRDMRHDERAVVATGLGLLFVVLTILTGSIWAKASWNTWWVWSDVRLVTYVVVGLLYGAYFLLRSSSEGDRRARSSAIFSIVAFASVPVSFYSVRVANSFVHPVVFRRDGADLPASMMAWFLVSLAAVIAIFVTFMQLELAQRRASKTLRILKTALEAR